MTGLAFLANAAMALLGTAICLSHALPDRDRLAFLVVAAVYGVVLEYLVILRFEAYRYNATEFLLTVGEVPVVIGLGWATIIYAGYHAARAFGVSRRTRPLFVALFALHIDLAIDAVAIRVPFWTWTPPGAWFGVPLGNFVGWFLVASLYVAAWDRLRPRLPAWLAAPASVPLAVFGLIVVLEAWVRVATTLPRKVALLGGALLGSLTLVVRDGIRIRRVDPRIAAVPLLYHGFYLALLLGFGMYRDQPLLPVVSLTMLGVGLALHRGSLP